MTAASFESMRLIIVVAAVLLKMILMPIYLQSYLNLAIQKLEIQKKEAGRITNVDLQKKVRHNDCILQCHIIIILTKKSFFSCKYLIKNFILYITDCSCILLSMCGCATIYCPNNYVSIFYISLQNAR